MSKADFDEGQLVLHHAARLSEKIVKYIHDRPIVHQYGMTVVAYAVEMLLSLPHEGNEMGYDKESEEFRRFLGTVHGDVKKIVNSSDGLAN